MSETGRKKVRLWDGVIEHEEEIAGPKARAINAGVDAFETHKASFLAIFRKEWERGPKADPLDVDRAWRRLTSLALEYFRRETLKKETVAAADRIDRLAKIKEVLDEARRLFDAANQDDLINDLYSAWWDQYIKDRENPKVEVDPDGSHVLVLVSAEFAQNVATLSMLHAAACKAHNEVLRQKGRPKGSILSADIIAHLAAVYQQSTGIKLDKLTDEHFVELVRAFLEAIGEARKRSKDYALDAIKYSLRLNKRERPIRE